ncbi:MAG TPA: putative metalloprotease CJM1_0395 family protein [Spirochaetia bacterium]|nr:putative metalloprotease CJM1_0395 family protein [Spirochaetia bacterium]
MRPYGAIRPYGTLPRATVSSDTGFPAELARNGVRDSTGSPQNAIVITISRQNDASASRLPLPDTAAQTTNQRELENAARQMRLLDAGVRIHEQAHVASLGAYASGPVTFGYATGPNGRTYAVSGAVRVNLEPVLGDPEATLRKARIIMNAALAPGEPSGPDVRVAAAAYLLERQAQQQIDQRQKAFSRELAAVLAPATDSMQRIFDLSA